MGLDLHAHVVVAVEPHHARVVLEHAHAPVGGAEGAADRAGGGEHRLLQQVVVGRRARRPGLVDRAAERLVAAVLAPGLGDRLEFDLAGRAAELPVVVADRVQLADGEGQALLPAQGRERRVVEPVEGDRLHAELPRPAADERPQGQRPDDHVVDRLAGQELPRQPRRLGLGQPGQPVLPHAANRRRREAQEAEGFAGGMRRWIGDARPRQHVHDRGQVVRAGEERGGAGLGGGERFDDRVGEHGGGEPFHVGPRQVALDQPAGGRAGVGAAGHPQLGGPGDHGPRRMIARGVAGVDVNLPQHRVPPWRGGGRPRDGAGRPPRWPRASCPSRPRSAAARRPRCRGSRG